MALSPRLEVKQGLGLTLTPQLMQSIRLLQLSHLELSAFVDAELLRNPLLEREDGSEPNADSLDEPAELPERPAELNAAEDTVDFSDRIQSADSIANGFDTEVENVFPEQAAQDRLSDTQPWNERGAGGEDAPDLDQFVAARLTLADHLAPQVALLLDDPAERLIAQFLVDGLNEAGYLAVELDTIAEQLGAPLATVEAVLDKLQGVEPVGLFARDVRECLALQLRERDRLDPMMARLLDPRPGRAFERGPVEAVVPDVFVREAPLGGWQIELNAEVLPRVLVNRQYYAQVTKKTRDTAEKTFLTDCLATANWLAKSLDQRAQTILKVTAEIVKQQDGFLVHGITHLRPMTLKTVADAIEMHESTVSRVTSNKYMMTPRGLFEMKYFFTTALGSSTGEGDHSAEAVRHRIKQIIDAETPADILSDDTIAEMLQKEGGIEVARRTVAKYREGMNIPSSVIRRRQKRAMAGAR